MSSASIFNGDYDLGIAMVARFPPQTGGKILVSARIIFTANSTEGDKGILPSCWLTPGRVRGSASKNRFKHYLIIFSWC